jgi:hypothetical protein
MIVDIGAKNKDDSHHIMEIAIIGMDKLPRKERHRHHYDTNQE